MSIKAYVDELEQIQAQIRFNNETNRNLRKRCEQLESSIAEYLVQKGQHGLKYNGKAVIIESKERRPPKKKKDKDADIISVLEEFGISNPTEAYTRIQEAQKGVPVEQQKIKFKKLNKI
jgi:hypothetical protein